MGTARHAKNHGTNAADTNSMVPPLLQMSVPVRPPLAMTTAALPQTAPTCHPLRWVMRVAVHAPAPMGTSIPMTAVAAQVSD
jgi:hypothetical protein